MARFNYGYHRKKMEEEEFAQIAKVCRAEGMPEETIELIHRILLDELNSDRKFYNHTQSYDSLQFLDDENTSVDRNPLTDTYLKNFSVPQIEIWEWGGWIEDLDTPEIIVWAQGLDEADRLLLSLLVEDGFKQTDAAKALEKHNTAISKKIKKLRESLAKVLPERVWKQYIK